MSFCTAFSFFAQFLTFGSIFKEFSSFQLGNRIDLEVVWRHLVTIRNDDANFLFFLFTPISKKACLLFTIMNIFLLGWLALLPNSFFSIFRFQFQSKNVTNSWKNFLKKFLFFGGINTYLKETETVDF